MIFRHINPIDKSRTAIAPYNFVPLPAKIFTVVDGIAVNGHKEKPWKAHDRFLPGTHSGWIDLKIKTKTPLFIRGPAKRRGSGWDNRDRRLCPESFTTPDGTPVIPGSSLRGMIRNIFEILSFSKITPITREKPFFRSMSTDRISQEYRRHFIEDLGTLQTGIDVSSLQPVSGRMARAYQSRVRAGTVHKSGSSWTIRECGLARIERDLIKKAFSVNDILEGSGSMASPDWRVQSAEVYVKADAKPRNYFFSQKNAPNGRMRHPDLYLRFRKVNYVSRSPMSEYQRAALVISGGIQYKHFEFVFLKDETYSTIPIPDRIWKRFHDEDQITPWQEKAFPKDKPTKGCRKSSGHLREDEPVFFICDDSNRSPDNKEGLFFGRAQMFRLPYDLSPDDLIPEQSNNASLDLTQAVFGQVGQQQGQTIKGRVFFEDAIATEGGPEWYAGSDAIVPQILSAPKVTTFQHYLTQDGTKNEKELKTYLAHDDTTIRGYKLYWHRWEEEEGLNGVKIGEDHDIVRQDLQGQNAKDKYKQYTIIRPVKKDVTFTGRVRFENLTDIELGALLCALRLPKDCAHKIGMAKPLGLGSIVIESVNLSIVDRKKRYQSWLDSGINSDDGNIYIHGFEGIILEHAKKTGETILPGKSGLGQIERLHAMFLLLNWDKRPEFAETRYMRIRQGDTGRFPEGRNGNEYNRRPVLPTPDYVIGQRARVGGSPSRPARP